MNNSVAIVTGASQGIGRSTAIRLARDFSAVVLAARNAKALEEVAAAIQQAAAEPIPIALDLSQVEAAEIVVNTTGPRALNSTMSSASKSFWLVAATQLDRLPSSLRTMRNLSRCLFAEMDWKTACRCT